jgi:sugar phosphate isomerase/epimerase
LAILDGRDSVAVVMELRDLTSGLPLAPTLAPLDTEPRRAFDRLREMRFRFVQLSATQPGMRPRDLDSAARRDLLATLRRRELSVSGLDAWIPPGHFLDARHVDRAMGAAMAAIDLAADVGRCPVSLSLPLRDSDDDEEGLDHLIDSLAEHAHHLGVAIADHAIPPREHEWIGVGIDPAAWLAHQDDPARAVSMYGDRIIAARVCDLLTSGMRGPVGDPQERQLDVLAYRVALSVSGYSGPIVIDARQWRDPWDGLVRTREAWERAG